MGSGFRSWGGEGGVSLPVALSPDIRHATHLLTVGPLFTLVLPLLIVLLVATLVGLPAIAAVDKGPLARLAWTEVIVEPKHSRKPPVHPGISVSGKHHPDQSSVKIPRHGLQLVALGEERKTPSG